MKPKLTIGGKEVPQCCLTQQTMRASGPGGQHVNKTESAVRLRLVLEELQLAGVVNAVELQKLQGAFPHGYVEARVQESRVQQRNQAVAVERIQARVEKALRPRKPRKVRKAPHSTTGGKRRKARAAHAQARRERGA